MFLILDLLFVYQNLKQAEKKLDEIPNSKNYNHFRTLKQSFFHITLLIGRETNEDKFFFTSEEEYLRDVTIPRQTSWFPLQKHEESYFDYSDCENYYDEAEDNKENSTITNNFNKKSQIESFTRENNANKKLQQTLLDSFLNNKSGKEEIIETKIEDIERKLNLISDEVENKAPSIKNLDTNTSKVKVDNAFSVLMNASKIKFGSKKL